MPGGTYSVTVTGKSGALQHTASFSLTVNPSGAPAGQITSIAPTSGPAGTLTVVTITGQNTNFVQGTTRAAFGPDTSVGGGTAGGFGPVTVTSPTVAVASVLLSGSASLGTRTVTVATGGARASLANARLRSFAFHIPSRDEIAMSDFQSTPE